MSAPASSSRAEPWADALVWTTPALVVACAWHDFARIAAVARGAWGRGTTSDAVRDIVVNLGGGGTLLLYALLAVLPATLLASRRPRAALVAGLLCAALCLTLSARLAHLELGRLQRHMPATRCSTM